MQAHEAFEVRRDLRADRHGCEVRHRDRIRDFVVGRDRQAQAHAVQRLARRDDAPVFVEHGIGAHIGDPTVDIIETIGALKSLAHDIARVEEFAFG